MGSSPTTSGSEIVRVRFGMVYHEPNFYRITSLNLSLLQMFEYSLASALLAQLIDWEGLQEFQNKQALQIRSLAFDQLIGD